MNTPLDLFSTSQTKHLPRSKKSLSSDRKVYDICQNNAPFFAYQIKGKTWGVIQGCCNDWNCPRCGQQRAREEYGRIVVGAREVALKHNLYFMTITCRGKEMSIEEAEGGYLGWTNSLLTRLRTSAKRKNIAWYYASVTERQTRKHPHSHYITTYCPDDVSPIKEGDRKYFYTTEEYFTAKHDTLQTEYLERACVECGLGNQYDLSGMRDIEGGSRYAAKYLFKASAFNTVWPKGWRRVRYSQNWPKLPEKTSTSFILLSAFDWYRLSREALIVKTKDDGATTIVRAKLKDTDTIVQ